MEHRRKIVKAKRKWETGRSLTLKTKGVLRNYFPKKLKSFQDKYLWCGHLRLGGIGKSF